MNKTFKVARSLTRGTVVTSEKASSYQGKAVKTVIAAAVASLVAGSAMATVATTVTVDGSLAVTAGQTGTVYTPNNVQVGEGTDAYAWGSKESANTPIKDELGATSNVILDGGTLSVTDLTQEINSITLGEKKNGNIAVTAGSKSAQLTLKETGVSKAVTYENLNLDLSVLNASATAGNATLKIEGKQEHTFASGTLKSVATGTGDKHGVAQLESAGVLNFGTKTELATGPGANESVQTPGTAYNFDIQANTEVSGTSVNLINGNVAVATGTKLTVTGTDAVSVKDEVAFKNTGLVTLSGATVEFDTAYDAAENTGKLVLQGTDVKVLGTLKGGELKVGALATNQQGVIEDTASVALVGTTSNVIEKDAVVNVDALTFGDAKTLGVSGSLTTAATNVNVSGASAITVDGTDAKASLGDITVKDVETQAAFTLTNSTNSAVTAKSLTVNAAKVQSADTNATVAGKFTLGAGKLNVGTVTNHGQINLAANTTLSINAAGESQNAGTIDGSGSLVVGKDVAFSNSKAINLGTDGTINVEGTLTNVYTQATLNAGKITTPAVYGQITAKTLTIGNGGVVVTEFAISDAGAKNDAPSGETTYTVGTTTIKEGGKFVTSLNSRADNFAVDKDHAADIIALQGAFELDGGLIYDRTEKAVSDLKVSGSGNSLTVMADYDFGKIVAKDQAKFTIDGGNVKLSSLTADQGTVAVTDGSLTTTLATLNLAVKGTAFDDNSTDQDTVADGAITIGSKGTLVISDYQGKETAVALKSTEITKLLDASAGKIASNAGIIDLGNVNFSDITANTTTKRYDYSALNAIHGITTDTFKAASFNADTIEHSESLGNIHTTNQALTLNGDVTVTLNLAAENGYLVWHDVVVPPATTSTPAVSDVTLTGGATLAVAGSGAVGKIEQGTSETGHLTVAEAGVLTAQTITVTDLDVAGTLNIAAATSGAEAYKITATNLDVTGTLTADANNLEIQSREIYKANAEDPFDQVSSIDGTASVKNLTMTQGGDLLVTGKAIVADTLNAGTVGTVYVGDDKNAGFLSVGKLVSGSTVFADPAWVDGKSEAASKVVVGAGETGTKVVAGRNSVAYLGITAEEDVKAADQAIVNSGYTLGETSTAEADGVRSEETKTVNSILYVAGADKTYLGFAAATDLTAESYEALPNSSQLKQELRNGVYVGKNSMLVMDAAKVDTTGAIAVFDKDVTLEEDSILFIDNLKNGDKIKLSQGAVHDHDAIVAFTGDLVMGYDFVANGDSATHEGTLAVTMQSGLPGYGFTGAGADLAYAYFAEGVNATDNSNAFLNKLLTSSTTFGDIYQAGKEDVNYTGLAKILNEGAAIGATTGVQTMTMDAVNQMADTVADRTSVLTQRGQGVNVWADVNGGKFEAKTLFDGAGYSSDIYSGVLGLDYQFSCNAVLGAALTIGTADTDSKNSAFKASTDSDLVGFSVYASKTFADIWNVSADIGYLQASNEVKADGYGFNYKFDQDTDAFTVGVRGEVLTKAGSVNIVPHVGLRYTALSTDGFEAAYVTDIDDQNIFQMPVGVTVSADFETSGWTIAPKFDLSVVPTFGDKDAELKLGLAGVAATATDSVRVIDSNPVQAQLGINATNGAWGFGLNYKLGVGSEDRMNVSFL